MSEDEAFIRAIVASPGDDLPRLVYADYLDERGDPRGTYLRTEVEWARTRNSDYSDRLRQMTTSLGAVWVARISRPPLGVCCDHLEFTNQGPVATEDDLIRFERNAHVLLPSDYRAFLLNINGGLTPVAWLPTPGNEAGIELSCLYGLGPASGTPIEGVRGSLSGLQGFGEDARGLLAIGDCGSQDWLIVMDVSRPLFTEVMFFEDYTEPSLARLTNTFAEFLNIVEPRQFEDS